MWNTWVDKAKDLAQNIDNQLNEAVGADGDPSNTAASTTSSSSAGAAAAPPPPTTTGPSNATTSSLSIGSSLLNATRVAAPNSNNDGDDDDDAWNDDFDFGDDDDKDGDGDVEKKDQNQEVDQDPVVPTPPTEPQATETEVEYTKAETVPVTESTSPMTAAAGGGGAAAVGENEAEDAAPPSPVVVKETSPEETLPPSSSPSKSGESADDESSNKDIEFKEEQELEKVDSPEVPMPTDDTNDSPGDEAGGDKEETGDAVDEDAEEKEETAADLPLTEADETIPAEEPVTVPAEETTVDVDNNDSSFPDADNEDEKEEEQEVNEEPEPSNESNVLPSPSAEPPTEGTAPEDVSKDDIGAESPTPDAETYTSAEEQPQEDDGGEKDNGGNIIAEDEDSPDATSPTQVEEPKRSSLFSNLAHRAGGIANRAEGLAHQAEGGVSSILAAASHLGDKIVQQKNDDDDNNDDVDKEMKEDGNLVDKSSVVASAFPVGGASAKVTSLFTSALNGATATLGVDDDKTKSQVEENDDGDDEWDDDPLEITENEEDLDDAVVIPDTTKISSPDKNLSNPPEEMVDSGTTGNIPVSANQSIDEKTSTNVSVSAGPESSSAVPVAVSIEGDPRYVKLREQLKLREDQLSNKAEQLNELQSLMETQEVEYKKKLLETREEAKKRIQRAKERCEAAEAKLKSGASSGAEDSAKQEQIIKALREEGQALAMKQAAMEQAVRAAKGESRQMAEQLDDEAAQKEQALEKISKLEMELKITKESLSAARKGESQAGKLESDLLAARSDAESKANTILSLQQQLKELAAESKELKTEIQNTRKAAAHEAQQEKSSLRREHNDLITDLEIKLRTTEREAGVREDALRHEVAELRKRWQDAVRRADALSMDIQSSTAPLLRQLESMERQNRARAANWAELEGRLRNELEESVIQNENLNKDRSEFKAKISRLERLVKERDDELTVSRKKIEDQTVKIEKLESQLAKLESEAVKRQEEYEKVERLANEGVARVRSEMTQTVVESEERYRGQIDRLEGELKVEKEKRLQLESQVDQLLENAGGILGASQNAPQLIRKESKPKKLRESEGQAEILAGALGLDDSDDDSQYGASDDELEEDVHNGVARDVSGDRRGSSFAALEQLTSRLKNAEVELKSLRKSLRDSESTRDSLVEELADTRHAKEKLPLFEAKVKELTEDNREKELEIMGLKEDILEVKELYRTQLNLLLEEKASENVETNDRRHSSPADVMDNAASTMTASSDPASTTPLATVDEPKIEP
mmetsp:Transcript_31328/g.75766  ORF Transcript_31328/g.75766 Transcript_31328/m.75766 type:complete len:1276 (-) Transcript_31328:59-3886(-)